MTGLLFLTGLSRLLPRTAEPAEAANPLRREYHNGERILRQLERLIFATSTLPEHAQARCPPRAEVFGHHGCRFVATFSYQPLLRAALYSPPGQLGTLSVITLVYCDCKSAGSSDQLMAGKPPMSFTTDT